MRKLFLATILLFFTAPAFSQTAFVEGEQCDGTVDAARGCLEIEASIVAFTSLRDALTPDWGENPLCGQCGVDLGVSICVSADTAWTLTRKQLALSRLTCRLRSAIVQADLASARQTADAGVSRLPDVGGGDPQ